ncbi:MAG TPA: IPT/TIG domain-containing protein [Kofleriaceae bacterium]|nr:IPT/TIG domain-containing protein [Kofleriaceae bacterium]
MVAIAALVGCGSNGNNVTCGDGTTLVDGVCEAGSGGSGGGGDTCGSGTMLQGTTCVATGGGDASAPAITSLSPSEAGVMGGGPFLIEGTGFDGDNVTSLDVYFGETADTNCEAELVVATATEISGVVPPFCDINVTVSVVTNLGTATTPFHYDAVFAADGDNFANSAFQASFGGELWVIDPFSTSAYDFGPIVDANGTDYPIGGLAFDSTGTLWAVTTGLGTDGDIDGVSQLATLDPVGANGPTMTIIGDTVDASQDGYFVRDLKMIGGTLYGYGYDITADTEGLVTIDPTSGAVTVVGTPVAQDDSEPFYSAGVAYDGTNTYVAAHLAGSDATDEGTGELDTADLTTGALTAGSNALDWPVGAPIGGMDVLTLATQNGPQAFVLAVIDDSTYGAYQALENESTNTIFGQFLAVIDPTAASGAVVNPQFAMPASYQFGAEAAVGAIAVPSSTTQTLQVARPLVTSKWQQLAASTKPSFAAPANPRAVTGKLVPHRSK